MSNQKNQQKPSLRINSLPRCNLPERFTSFLVIDPDLWMQHPFYGEKNWVKSEQVVEENTDQDHQTADTVPFAAQVPGPRV